jgi:hypothetical protein
MSAVKTETKLAKIVHLLDPGFTRGPMEVVINHGSRQGVQVGDRFVVFGTGPHIIDPDTGEDLGVLELVRGQGQIVNVQEHLSTLRTIERRRTRPAKRIITREPGLGSQGFIMSRLAGPSVTEEELAPEEEVPFDSVQLGDLAKPI